MHSEACRLWNHPSRHRKERDDAALLTQERNSPAFTVTNILCGNVFWTAQMQSFRFHGSVVMGDSIPFYAHVELLQLFLAHREEIVEKIQALLNAQRKPIQYLQDVPVLSRHFEDCFFTLTSVTGGQSRLRGQLEKAHWASGFKPREMPGPVSYT